MSEATQFDLYFEISNGAPFTLLGMWEELLVLAAPKLRTGAILKTKNFITHIDVRR